VRKKKKKKKKKEKKKKKKAMNKVREKYRKETIEK